MKSKHLSAGKFATKLRQHLTNENHKLSDLDEANFNMILIILQRKKHLKIEHREPTLEAMEQV